MRGLLLSGVTLSVMTVVSGAALAQEGGDDVIMVTARRVAEDVQDVPVAMNVLSGEALRELNVADIKDITRTVPNLQILAAGSERSAVFIAIRGQSAADVTLTADSSVGLYLDGVNIPRVFGLSPGLIDLERVEVLKGPQGTLYGRNTTGGAISFVTRAPELGETGGFASVEAGSYNRIDASGAFNLPFGEDAALRVVARRTTQDGTGQDASGRDVNDEDNQYYRARFHWAVNDDVRFDFTADYTSAESGGQSQQILSLNGFPPRAGLSSPSNALFEIAAESGLSLADADLLASFAAAQALWEPYVGGPGRAGGDFYDTGSDLEQFNDVEAWGLGGTLRINLNDAWALQSITGVRHFKRTNLFDLDATPFLLLHPFQSSDSDFFSEELQLNYTGDRVDSILGVYYSHEEGQERGATRALEFINPNNPNRVLGDVTNSSWAIYGQGTFDITDTLRFTAGLRWTEEEKELVNQNSAGTPATCSVPTAVRDDPAVCASTNSDTFSDYSYLFGLDYRPNTNIMVYARTSRGFRGGGQNLRAGTTALTFDAFDPEIATDYEIGVKSDFASGRGRLNAALFRTDYQDIQRSIFVLNPATSAVTSVFQNAAEATIDGLEIDGEFDFTETFTVSGTMGWLDAGYEMFTDATRDRSDEPFATPEWTYSLAGRYERPTSFGSVLLRIDYDWWDDQVLRPSALIDADVTQEAFGLVSGRVSVNLDRSNTSISVFGRNLTDEQYIAGVVDLDSSLGWNVGFQGAPRTYGVEITKRWGGG